ncbi:hypothetical protein CLU81_3206 [Flavobacterium sp. 9]|nr:hypothetical protein CLU81_3206 [Flavobacterium sp. 9]
MKNFITLLILNILWAITILFLLLVFLFLLGSGSAGFNDNWYYIIILIGIIHSITCVFLMKTKPNYYLIIAIIVLGTYLYFYFE